MFIITEYEVLLALEILHRVVPRFIALSEMVSSFSPQPDFINVMTPDMNNLSYENCLLSNVPETPITNTLVCIDKY